MAEDKKDKSDIGEQTDIEENTEDGLPEEGGIIAKFKGILYLRGPARMIALGAAIGTFVAWLPIMGIQMSVAVPICLAIGANPLPAIPIIWLTNPITALPIYGFNYWVGIKLVAGPEMATFRREFASAMDTLEKSGARAFAAQLFDQGVSVAYPLWVGSAVVGGVLAILTYYGVLYGVMSVRFRLRRRRNRLRRLAREKELKKAQEVANVVDS